MRTSATAIAVVVCVSCGPFDAADMNSRSASELTAATPFSLHVIDRADTSTWDAIATLTDEHEGPIICSQRRPESVPPERWCRMVSILYVVEDGVTHVHANGNDLFDTVERALSADEPPALVMIDEVRSGSDGRAKVARAARRLAQEHPEWRGRWGAFLVDGLAVSYASGLNAAPHHAVDALLDADAMIAVEMYPHRASYCESGSTTRARDEWLTRHYRGDANRARFPWLVERRTNRGSTSHLSVVFAVTDDFVGSSQGAIYLDRLMYVWATSSQHRWAILESNGGPGAWKWDAPHVSNTSRDAAFAASYEHYAVAGSTSSRLGPVPCP